MRSQGYWHRAGDREKQITWGLTIGDHIIYCPNQDALRVKVDTINNCIWTIGINQDSWEK